MGEPVRKVGVEEEFHLIDLRTRRLTPRAPELLAALPAGSYVEELQRCVIESNSGAFTSLDALRKDLRANRDILIDTARDMGMGVVAAGSVPLAVPTELQVTETPRYRRMLADYQLLAREQLICGTQVHVDVADRDEAVTIAAGISPYLPTLLALSSSSPFWSDGSDTGYASARTLVWQRWPTTGPFPDVRTAEDYDDEIHRLIHSGVIADPGMVYFDVRPSARLRTLELRVCDSCPSVDTITLIAGLYRALALRAAAEPDSRATPAPALYRAAIWQAARSGLEGSLIDIPTAAPKPARRVVGDLVTSLRPQLEDCGDWDTISSLAARAVDYGSSSSRQRRILRKRGRLSEVVDKLVAETAGSIEPIISRPDPHGTLLFGYTRTETDDEPDSCDEAVSPDLTVHPDYRDIMAGAAALGAAELRHRQYQIEREQSIDGVTFRVSGQDRAQIFPLDVVPRIVDGRDWERTSRGLKQRALALNAFLCDIYTDQQIVADGILPPEVLDRAPGYRRSGGFPRRQPVRTHICGTDLIATEPGRFVVLEDNLRVPSGVAYAMANRDLMSQFLPEIPMPDSVLPIDGVPAMIGETIALARPPHAADDGVDVLLSSGWTDSAWFEHKLVADGAGLHLAQPEDLSTDGDRVHLHRGRHSAPVNTIYARMDEDMLLSSFGVDEQPLRAGVVSALEAGTLTIANALGNGVGDDKAVYAYVPAMIEYYLGERPLLDQVPTWLCAEREQRDHVLSRLEELVVKPIDGLGGSGITIGPEATDKVLDERRKELLTHPERFVAQEVVQLSTHPTFDDDGFWPHHVDLRAFVHLRGTGDRVAATVAPAALTRVAPTGSLIVNSSRGGGGKDTWILGTGSP
ncbi:carboxylate--amine ligase/circularly permuted type 2 ATP-grasp protein [Williamsia sterculiae]|uniref:Putative glutamate--cysteine ligase 2 n=1 Tax=Williamsia sterculiae TaxID=1344003 RepID=A0A1N7GQZ7_9NOCA|nr:carboxylate--amine ligase/circularly permuted type 2 ATP-grasp protein [Williamsia sterculiae]SIS15004.1 carboxylate-amine ligase [Williamsia sterculiae]